MISPLEVFLYVLALACGAFAAGLLWQLYRLVELFIVGWINSEPKPRPERQYAPKPRLLDRVRAWWRSRSWLRRFRGAL